MPTPRHHGGAPVVNVTLTLPGYRGLNTAEAGAILDPSWATRLENTVIDRNGRIAARKGWHSHTNTPHGNAFINGIEYRESSDSRELVITTDTEVLVSVDDGQTFADVTGTAAFTSGNWYLVNFNDFIVGFQQDEEQLVYNGTTSSQTAGSPTGRAGTAAFGRIWASNSDNTVLHYSALLDHTDYAGADAGSFDLKNIFPSIDTIIAVRQHNNFLVVFGAHNILVYEDGTGSDKGIDPTQMVLVDSIAGTGCLSQNSIQDVDGDLWFVSNSFELVSFKRIIVGQKSGEIDKLSKNVSDRLRDRLDDGSFEIENLRSMYSPVDRFYLLSLPEESSSGAGDETGSVFCFDSRQFLDDGSARCVGIWNQMVPTLMIYQDNDREWVAALKTKTGELGHYHTFLDDEDSYTVIYESGWLDITQEGFLIILKRFSGLFFGDLQTTILMKWAFDFDSIFTTRQVVLTSTGTTSEWGTSEWGIAQWGGGVDIKNRKVSGAGSGEFLKVGIEATIDGGQFAIQNLDINSKVGRIA